GLALRGNFSLERDKARGLGDEAVALADRQAARHRIGRPADGPAVEPDLDTGASGHESSAKKLGGALSSALGRLALRRRGRAAFARVVFLEKDGEDRLGIVLEDGDALTVLLEAWRSRHQI